MTSLAEFLDNASTPGPGRLVPGCVLVVANKDGVKYSKCFGTASVDPDSPLVNKPLSLDTTMWYASCTKLLTAVAALQCVEKGLLKLDEDISNVLSEWKEPYILKGFDDTTGEPIMKNVTTKITLRMLLTHQSGMGYSFIDPKLNRFVKYKEETGQINSRLIRDMYFLPLLFEPATSWSYGVGSDWAGQMIERVTGQRLESYMKDNIFNPLGMNLTSFRLLEKPEISARRADMTIRIDDGTVMQSPTRYFPDDSPDDHGGGGIYSSAADYIKVLIALLRNDETILNAESMDLLFTPCLSAAASKTFQEVRSAQNQASEQKDSMAMGGVTAPVEVNYALGGMVVERDSDGGRKEGSLAWGGLPNVSWMVDRKSNVAFLYASQLLPPGDKVSKNIISMFEKAVYSGELKDSI